MRILVACEHSGAVRDAFRRRGHDAWSADLKEGEGEYADCHVRGDCMALLVGPGALPWDVLIAFPPCTYLSASGLHWNGRREGRAEKTEAALQFVRALMAAPVKRIAIENPVGCISSRIRPADQTIQPYQFGHDASKRTCLWLHNLPRLRPTKWIEPRYVDGKPRWDNQTDGGQNKLPPSEERATLRALTYPGIANAMADQWGAFAESFVKSA
jgi:site-specific DNA-cytosine methylase